jgi:predicted acyl esterase
MLQSRGVQRLESPELNKPQEIPRAQRRLGKGRLFRKLRAHPDSLEVARRHRFALLNANHVFLPEHRIMVQIQSSWFPLYDRNPQTFVPNIFWAKPGEYRKPARRAT